MASNHVCIICTETEKKEPGLKLFSPERCDTAQKAAARRTTLQNYYFFCISKEIRKIEQPEGKYYHTKCFSRFCAVKTLFPVDSDWMVAVGGRSRSCRGTAIPHH